MNKGKGLEGSRSTNNIYLNNDTVAVDQSK